MKKKDYKNLAKAITMSLVLGTAVTVAQPVWAATHVKDDADPANVVFTYDKDSKALSWGYSSSATGNYATAFGYKTSASGSNATSFGNLTVAKGDRATAFGYQTVANGKDAVAFGTGSIAGGTNSLAALGGVTGTWNSLPTYDAENKQWIDGTYSGGGKNAVAIGVGAVAAADYNVAIGHFAQTGLATTQHTTPGTKEIVTEFAVGGGMDEDGNIYYSQITGVADGTNDHDAATVGQLNKKQDKLTSTNAGANITIDDTTGMISLATEAVQGSKTTTTADDTYAVYDKNGFKAVKYVDGTNDLATMVGAEGLKVAGDTVKVGVDTTNGLAGFMMQEGSTEGKLKVALGSDKLTPNPTAPLDPTKNLERNALSFGVDTTGAAPTTKLSLGTLEENGSFLVSGYDGSGNANAALVDVLNGPQALMFGVSGYGDPANMKGDVALVRGVAGQNGLIVANNATDKRFTNNVLVANSADGAAVVIGTESPTANTIMLGVNNGTGAGLPTAGLTINDNVGGDTGNKMTGSILLGFDEASATGGVGLTVLNKGADGNGFIIADLRADTSEGMHFQISDGVSTTTMTKSGLNVGGDKVKVGVYGTQAGVIINGDSDDDHLVALGKGVPVDTDVTGNGLAVKGLDGNAKAYVGSMKKTGEADNTGLQVVEGANGVFVGAYTNPLDVRAVGVVVNDASGMAAMDGYHFQLMKDSDSAELKLDGLTVKDSTKTVTFGVNGISAGGQKIENVASAGTLTNTNTNAVNGADLYAIDVKHTLSEKTGSDNFDISVTDSGTTIALKDKVTINKRLTVGDNTAASVLDATGFKAATATDFVKAGVAADGNKGFSVNDKVVMGKSEMIAGMEGFAVLKTAANPASGIDIMLANDTDAGTANPRTALSFNVAGTKAGLSMGEISGTNFLYSNLDWSADSNKGTANIALLDNATNVQALMLGDVKNANIGENATARVALQASDFADGLRVTTDSGYAAIGAYKVDGTKVPMVALKNGTATAALDATGLNVNGGKVMVGVDGNGSGKAGILINGTSKTDNLIALGTDVPVGTDKGNGLAVKGLESSTAVAYVGSIKESSKINTGLMVTDSTGKIMVGTTEDWGVGMLVTNGSDKTITINPSGISMGSQQITNLASAGTLSATNTNAVNGADLYAIDVKHTLKDAEDPNGNFDITVGTSTTNTTIKLKDKVNIKERLTVGGTTAASVLDVTGFKAANGADFVKAGVTADGNTKGFSVNDKVVAGQIALNGGMEGFAVLSTAATPASGFDILLANDKDAGFTRTALSFNVNDTKAGLSIGEIAGTNFLYSGLDWSADTAKIALLDNTSNGQALLMGEVKNANVGGNKATARVALQANDTADGLYVTGGTGVEAAIGTYKVNGTKVPTVSLKNGIASTVLDASGMNIGADKVKVGVYNTQAGVLINGENENDNLIALGTGFTATDGVGAGNGLQVKSLSNDGMVVAVGSMGTDSAANTGLMVTNGTGKVMVGNTEAWGIGMLMEDTNGTATLNTTGLNVTGNSKAVTFGVNGISAGSQQITNVASAGTLSDSNTNAVNGADLYAIDVKHTLKDADDPNGNFDISVTDSGTTIKLKDKVNIKERLTVGGTTAASVLDATGLNVSNIVKVGVDSNSTGVAGVMINNTAGNDTLIALGTGFAAGNGVGAEGNGLQVKSLADDNMFVTVGSMKNPTSADTGLMVSDTTGDNVVMVGNTSAWGVGMLMKDAKGIATLNTTGLDLGKKNDKDLKFTSEGISAGEQRINNVADGKLELGSHDAINADQFIRYSILPNLTALYGLDRTKVPAEQFIMPVAEGRDSLAVGSKSVAQEQYAVAVGFDSAATGLGSVAVGALSKASGAWEFSVGGGTDDSGNTVYRKVTNVADGSIAADSHDAVTGGQMFTELGNKQDKLTAGSNITIDSNIVALKDEISVNTLTASKDMSFAAIGVEKNSGVPYVHVANITASKSASLLESGLMVKDGSKKAELTATGLDLGTLSEKALKFTSDGISAGAQKIKNVADGSDDNDAVTFGQMNTELGKKQDNLTTVQLAAVDSGITSTKVGEYDTHVADSDIHVTAEQKTAWTAKQEQVEVSGGNLVLDADKKTLSLNPVLTGMTSAEFKNGAYTAKIGVGDSDTAPYMSLSDNAGYVKLDISNANLKIANTSVSQNVELTTSGLAISGGPSLTRENGLNIGTGNTWTATNGIAATTAKFGDKVAISSTGIAMDGTSITGLAAGTANTDAANMSQIITDVDGNLDWTAANVGKKLSLKTALTGMVSAEFSGDVKAGSFTVGTGDAWDVTNGLKATKVTVDSKVAISKDGINMGGTKIIALADGNVAAGSYQAVNGHQLYDATYITSAGNFIDGTTIAVAVKDAVMTLDNAVAENAAAINELGENKATKTYIDYRIGKGNTINGNNSFAIGNNNIIDGAAAKNVNNAFAIGNGNTITKNRGLAFGIDNKVDGYQAIAIGSDAEATANNAIALGFGSVANVENTVSVGKSGSERKIVNVADGTDDHDAVTFGQMNTKFDEYTTTADLSSTYLTQSDAASTYAAKATTLSGYGITDAYTKTEVDTELGKKQDKLTVNDSNVVITDDSKISLNKNLTGLTSATFENALYTAKIGVGDSDGAPFVTLSDSDNDQKLEISNTGLTITNTDGVTHTVELNDSGLTINDGPSLTRDGGLVVDSGNTWTAANGLQATKAKFGGKVEISANGINMGKKAITNLADGWVAANSYQAINGHQLFDAAYVDAGNYVKKGTAKAAIKDLDTQVKANANTIFGLSTGKADVATTLAGYGITDAYTIDQIDSKIGKGSTVNGNHAVAIGYNNSVNGNNSFAFGYNNTIDKKRGLAFGSNITVSGIDAIAIGNGAQANANNAVAFGQGAEAKFANSVALGNDSVTTEENTVSVGSDTLKRKIVNVADGAIVAGSYDAVNGGQLYTRTTMASASAGSYYAAGADVVTAVGALDAQVNTNATNISSLQTSVGAIQDYVTPDGLNANGKKIVGVADGNIAKNSWQAINGRQLWNEKQVQTTYNGVSNSNTIGKNIDALNNTIGDYSTVTGTYANTGIIAGDMLALDTQVGLNTTAISDLQTSVGGKQDKFDAGANLEFTGTAGTDLTLKLKEDITLNSATFENEAYSAKIGVESDNGAPYVSLSDKNSKQKLDMSNKGIKITNTDSVNFGVELNDSGLTISDGPSLTRSGLSFGAGNTWTKDGGITTTSVTATSVTADAYKVGDKTYIDANGINANGQKITNVAPGENETDVATVGQVATVESGLRYDLDSLGSQVNKLDSRVNKVGAGAAALAALHPLDFDPDNKLSFSAGVGNYKGENAAALGVFYRPMDRVMFSMGATMGNDNNMVNAGITFALDRKVKSPDGVAASSYKKASREVLYDEVYLLNAENTKMNDKMESLNDENVRLSDRMQEMERKLAQQAAISRRQLAEKDAKFEKAMAEQNAKIANLMKMLEKAMKK